MNQSQGTSSLCSPDLPMKRKRGRPRKDENLVHGESMSATPGPDSLKKNKHSAGTSDDVEDEMVGQVVSGVIEGSFDAGYLLNVKIGDTNTQLRGVVFLPGKFAPVTPANDVAPHVKMCKRKEIPIPAVNLQSHLYGSACASDQSNRQPVKVKKQIPAVPGRIPPFIPQSGIPGSPRIQSTSFLFLPVDNFHKNDAPMPQPSVKPGTDIPSTNVTSKSEKDVIVEQDTVLEEVDPATMTGPNDVDVNKETETSSEAIGNVPNIEIVCKNPPIELAGVVSDSSALIQDGVKVLNFELNQNPLVAEAAPAIVEPQAMDIEKSLLVDDEVKNQNLVLNQVPAFVEHAPNSIMLGVETVFKDPKENVGSEKSANVVKNLVAELNQTPVFAEPTFAEPTFAGSDPTSKPVKNLMEEDPDNAPKPNHVNEEKVSVAAEESIPSRVTESHISTSSFVVDIADPKP